MQRAKPRLVITGGSGLLALNWAAHMAQNWDVTLLQNHRQVSVGFAKTQMADLRSEKSVAQIFEEIEPDLVVNTAALSNVDLCQTEPERAFEINAELAGRIAQGAWAVGARCIQISTDHLSDGTAAFLPETASVFPMNKYAESKLAGEERVLGAHPDALVLRTNFFGWGPAYRNSFSDIILQNLRAGWPLHLFEDAYFSPILIEDLVEIAHELNGLKATGIFNVAGLDRVSKLEFGLRLASTFDLDASSIVRSRLKDRDDLTLRPLDMSLDTTKIQSTLSTRLPNLSAGLTRLKQCEADHPVKGLGPFMIPYGRHHIDADDRAAVADFLDLNGWLTQGPTVEAFERAVAERVGVNYAVAVSNGTAGLHLASLAAGLTTGDKLLTTPTTFVATANAAQYCGADLAFADIDPDTGNISPKAVRSALDREPQIKVISPVHLTGLPCDMAAISEIARAKGVTIIEDAAHALGSLYADGSPVGNCAFSDMTVFSFHPVKAIAMGEGGLVTTNDEELYRSLLRLRSHGINKLDDEFEHPEESGPWYYEMQELGYNYRITDLQCALGLSQLKKLDRFVARRRTLAAKYDAAFKDHLLVRPAQNVDKSMSAHHIYVVTIDFEAIGWTRIELMNELRAHGIGSQVHYVPVPMHPYYRKQGYTMRDLPNAQQYYDTCLTIPLYYDLTDDEQERVIAVLFQLLDARRASPRTEFGI
jgi:perosamine synthetase